MSTGPTKLPLGWVPFVDRDKAQNDAHDAALATMPRFFISGPPKGPQPLGTKVLLTDTWKHPAVVARLGLPFTGIRQVTGSCVGAGGGNMLFTLAALEIIRAGQNEDFIIPFWLLPYGRSRLDGGMRGQGEGSLGSTFAQAVREDGVLDAKTAGLPPFTTDNMFCWGNAVEMQWSDGARIDPKLLEQSRKHLVKTTAELHSAAEVRDAILNGYPVTRAFGYFANPGTPTVQQGALLASYNGAGGHQETWLGYWNHPDLGELIWEQNQWGLSVYDSDPGGGPSGGCWQKFDAVDKACKSGDAEVFAFSQFSGYPGQELTNIFG